MIVHTKGILFLNLAEELKSVYMQDARKVQIEQNAPNCEVHL